MELIETGLQMRSDRGTGGRADGLETGWRGGGEDEQDEAERSDPYVLLYISTIHLLQVST